jgi:hypothetical protein
VGGDVISRSPLYFIYFILNEHGSSHCIKKSGLQGNYFYGPWLGAASDTAAFENPGYAAAMRWVYETMEVATGGRGGGGGFNLVLCEDSASAFPRQLC